MRTYRTEGIILKRSNYSETDRILTIFTKNHGKIRIIAKGVRKITSRRCGSLELFNLASFCLNKGKNWDSLSEVEVVNSYSGWRKEIKAVGVAYYFCELVDKLTAEEQEHCEVFELLKNSLINLNKGYFKEAVYDFEKNILLELGFGIPAEYQIDIKSLRDYIEQISERKINSPKIIKQIW